MLESAFVPDPVLGASHAAVEGAMVKEYLVLLSR